MEDMARELANYTWKAEIEPKLARYVSFFRAAVVSPPKDGAIIVQSPYAPPISVPYVGSAATLNAGDQCVVLVFGSMSNAICIGDGMLSNL